MAGVMGASACWFHSRVQPRFKEVQGMRKPQRYRSESLRRIQQFRDAHQDVLGEIKSSEASKQLDDSITAISAAMDVQLSRERQVRGEREQQTVLERDLRHHHMAPVGKFARGRLAAEPKIASLTPAADTLKGAKLVTAARGMAEAATPLAEKFAAANFPADFIEQLSAAADAVQHSIETRGRLHAERLNAGATIRTQLEHGTSAALMVESAVARLVPRSSPLYAEWRSIKRVFQAARRPQPVAGDPAVPASPAAPADPTPSPAPALATIEPTEVKDAA
jgi:hypothetical protein